MKKIIFSLFVVSLTSSFAFAQQQAVPAVDKSAMAMQAPKVKDFIGKVESVSAADPAKGTKSEIVVMDKENKKVSFIVKATTTIYDSASAAITLEKIKVGDNVNIKYKTTKEGLESAISIHIVA
jgi:hypothetical protein